MKIKNSSYKLPIDGKEYVPTMEAYTDFKERTPKVRKMRGTQLSRIKEIEACLKRFPEANSLIKDSAFQEFKVPIWTIYDDKGHPIHIESAPHSKVYRVGMNKKILYKLPNAAHALFNWIILNQEGNGYVFLNEEKIRKEMVELKHYNTFNKRALESLINAGIIAEYHKPYYLINPRFIHFGSRAKSYPHFITSKKDYSESLEINEGDSAD